MSSMIGFFGPLEVRSPGKDEVQGSPCLGSSSKFHAAFPGASRHSRWRYSLPIEAAQVATHPTSLGWGCEPLEGYGTLIPPAGMALFLPGWKVAGNQMVNVVSFWRFAQTKGLA